MELRCPVEYFNHSEKSTLLCRGPSCTEQADRDTCCVKKGQMNTCADFQCPQPGYRDDPQKSTQRCPGTICGEEGLQLCCNKLMPCTEFTCLPGYQKKENVEDLFCSNSSCHPDDDHSTCCDELASCTEAVCPPEYADHPQRAERFCSGTTCEGSNISPCCLQRQTCSEFECPEGYALRSGTHYCGSDRCSNSADKNNCCESAGDCSTGFECPGGWTARKADANGDPPRCHQALCDGVNDRDSCCIELATCANMSCADGSVHHPTMLCSSDACTTDDEPTCCTAQQEDYKRIERVEVRQSCLGYGCPPGFKSIPNRAGSMCAGAECNDGDLPTCCTEVPFNATCESFSCQPPWFESPELAMVRCGDAACNDADTPKCCRKQKQCSELNCPAGSTQAEDSQMLHCAGSTCQATDYAICCQPLPTCGNYTCPPGH